MKKYETTDPVQIELASYSEGKLQTRIIEPLLRAMEFKDVRDRSGVNEKGKDLTAVKDESFGRSYYAIQIKKTHLSGKVGASNSLSFLLGQLRQALLEKIVFPAEMEPRKPNRLIFITPFPMENTASNNLEQSLMEIKSQGVTIVDGILLSDLVRQYLPEFLTGEEIYRNNIFNISDSLHETTVALQTHRALRMQDIYVDVSVADSKGTLGALIDKQVELGKRKKVGALSSKDKENTDELSVSDSKFGITFDVITKEELKKSKSKLTESDLLWPTSKSELEDFKHFAVVSPEQLFQQLVIGAIYCENTLFSPREVDDRKENLGKGFDLLHDIDFYLTLIIKIPFFKRLWFESFTQNRKQKFLLDSTTLLDSRRPICIVGPAGSGKTTLLKHLTQFAAKNNDLELPVFVPLLRLSAYTKKGIVNYITDDLIKAGFNLKPGSESADVANMLKKGELRIHLDGLDETGDNSYKALNAIKDTQSSFPNVPIIVTSRHTVKIDWSESIRFSIEPFSKEKLGVFIQKWFRAEPTAQRELINWVENHKRLQAVAQTPLIASLLCVLYSADLDLPETEDELYSRRLDLLLGQWDSAKGVNKMPKKRRDAYKLYLITLAFKMHELTIREIPFIDAIEKAEPFYKEFQGTKSTIVVDCISRGLLYRNENGNVTFGHLTYQEHLAAMYLAKHNPVASILEKLDQSWWAKCIEFYAMQMTSIDQLIIQSNKSKRIRRDKVDMLATLVELAPYTQTKINDRPLENLT